MLLWIFLFCSLSTTIAGEVAQRSPSPRLKDASLRCCFVAGEPYSFPSSNPLHNVDGVYHQFFHLLKEVTGFHCSSYKEFKQDDNTGWDSYIRMIARCANPNGTIAQTEDCPCDIGAALVYQAPHRSIVDFLPSVLTADHVVITHVNNTWTTSHPLLFVDTFQPIVWVYIIGLVGAFSSLKVAHAIFFSPKKLETEDETNSNDTMRLLPERKLTLRMVFPLLRTAWCATKSTLMAMITQTDPAENKCPRIWFLNYVICLCGLVLVLIYESAMTAILVQDKIVADYTQYSDLLDCNFDIKNVCIATGSFIDIIYGDIIEERRKRGCLNEQHPSNPFPSYPKLFTAVNEENANLRSQAVALGFLKCMGDIVEALLASGNRSRQNGVPW